MIQLYQVFDFLDKHYVEYIKKYYHDHNSQDAVVGNSSRVNKKIRNNSIVWFKDSSMWNQWIELLQKFDNRIDWIQTPQISFYDQGQQYDWHFDTGPKNRTHIRHLTLNVEIQSAPGAGFEIEGHGIISMLPGQAVVFPSKDLHRALPPISGSRISFTIWGMALSKYFK